VTSNKRLRVGVLFGGRSGEHEVSLASATSVIRGLDPDKYEAVRLSCHSAAFPQATLRRSDSM
jgi:D-alanine-D-alanine ligase-like ATP-grasp enzyme